MGAYDISRYREERAPSLSVLYSSKEGPNWDIIDSGTSLFDNDGGGHLALILERPGVYDLWPLTSASGNGTQALPKAECQYLRRGALSGRGARGGDQGQGTVTMENNTIEASPVGARTLTGSRN